MKKLKINTTGGDETTPYFHMRFVRSSRVVIIMNILEAFYYGNIRPDVKLYGKNSPFAELIHLNEKNRDNLLQSLDDSEKETFEKLNDAQSELGDIIQYQKFSYGFRLGALLMAEVFTGKADLLDSYE